MKNHPLVVQVRHVKYFTVTVELKQNALTDLLS